jgi:hypothetical protein
VQRADLAQQAVDAVADAQEGGFGLEVQVGGAALDGVGEEGVDEADHRLGVFAAAGRLAEGVGFAAFDLVEDAVDGQLVAIELVAGLGDLGLAGQQDVDLVPGGRLLRSWSRATMLSTSLEAMTRWRWLAS